MKVNDFNIVPMLPCHVPADFAEQAQINLSRGIALSLMLDGQVIGIAGVVLFHDGVGEAWVVPVADIELLKSKAKGIIIACIAGLQDITARFGMRRIQAIVPEEYFTGRKFARILGFKQEGIMKKYAEDGKNSIMFARVWGE